jgi:hypothetical protein
MSEYSIKNPGAVPPRAVYEAWDEDPSETEASESEGEGSEHDGEEEYSMDDAEDEDEDEHEDEDEDQEDEDGLEDEDGDGDDQVLGTVGGIDGPVIIGQAQPTAPATAAAVPPSTFSGNVEHIGDETAEDSAVTSAGAEDDAEEEENDHSGIERIEGEAGDAAADEDAIDTPRNNTTTMPATSPPPPPPSAPVFRPSRKWRYISKLVKVTRSPPPPEVFLICKELNCRAKDWYVIETAPTWSSNTQLISYQVL